MELKLELDKCFMNKKPTVESFLEDTSPNFLSTKSQDSSPSKSPNSENQTEKLSSPLNNTPTASVYDFSEYISTKRSNVSMLSSDLVKIIINDAYPKTSGGLIKTTHTVFVIETAPYGWRVERDFKDLSTFRECIHKQFPGDIIPPMNKALFEGENSEVLRTRKKYLQLFFDDLIQHKGIMCYELTEKFLKITDEKELDQIFLQEANKKAPINIKDMFHFNGNVYWSFLINFRLV